MTTTDQQAAFLRAICEQPHDNGPREMYADWLMERDDPRGEFIMVQLLMSRPPQCEWMTSGLNCHQYHTHVQPGRTMVYCKECGQWWKARSRERELLAEDGLPVWGRRSRERNGVRETQAYRWMPPGAIAAEWCEFRRGFVESVECRTQDWLDHGKQLVLAAPITEVRITDREPCRWNAFVSERSWFHSRLDGAIDALDQIPFEWFKLLTGRRWGPNSCARDYDTAELAHTDLSRAAVAWARGRAGLPKLEE